MNDWDAMAGGGVGHLVMFAITLVAFLYPVSRILQRIGYSPAWALVALVPLFNLVALWVLAFSEWPPKRDGNAS